LADQDAARNHPETMSKLASVALLASASALVLTASSDASACWNGVSAHTERVGITEIEDAPSWSPARVRDYATWMKRIEALLPAGHSVYTADPVTVHLDGADEDSEDDDTYESGNWGDPEGVFDAVVKLTKTKKKARRRALAIKADVFTVQVGALADAKLADELVERTARAESVEEGFFHVEWDERAGYANVVNEPDAKGRVLYKVVSGAFLDEREARVVATKLSRELGVAAFVRKL
jgi:hypothetical protein